jgi:FkbH-like protein
LTSHPELQQGTMPTAGFSLADADVLAKRHSLKSELLKQQDLAQTRIAILGGSTSAEVRNALELFLLTQGIQPSFYESDYNRYYEDVLLEDSGLWSFKPNIVFIHTTWKNVSQFPRLMASQAEVEECVRIEMAKLESMWTKIHHRAGAVIIQNNFDLPRTRLLGNLEASEVFGKVHFLLRLNAEIAHYARSNSRFLVNDILYLSAELGLKAWHDSSYWHRFHMALSPIASVSLGRSVAAIVKAIYGKAKKCLVLDLDNTLWGGVIGDDGVENLVLGQDNPIGEAFLDFQRYVKGLQERGVILTVCSKNDPDNAASGFLHPDSALKREDFSAFYANWDPKPENIRKIAAELGIGLDSMVFVDDNPVERALVARELPEVAVPDLGTDVSSFADRLERERYFELEKLVQDDISRSTYYSTNARRGASELSFSCYGEFLASLDMKAEIGPFCAVYMDRITQLINKTNQFNLTTRRYTRAEVESIAADESCVTLYGRLSDKFGDNGLVSVLIGLKTGSELELDVWLMSCRVLKREMELAMFDSLLELCQSQGIRRVVGIYVPSKKNKMVAEHYAGLGFVRVDRAADGREVWHYNVPQTFSSRSLHIRRTGIVVPVASS